MCAAPISEVSSARKSRAFGTPRPQVRFLHLRSVLRRCSASRRVADGSRCAFTQSRKPAVATDRLRAACEGAAPEIRRAQAVMYAESLCACPRKATGTLFAPVVELADTPGLEPGAARLPSSTLGGRTTTNHSRYFPYADTGRGLPSGATKQCDESKTKVM